MHQPDFHHDPMISSARTVPVYMSTWHERDMWPCVSLSRIDALPQDQVCTQTVDRGQAPSAHVPHDMNRSYCPACNRSYAEYRGVKHHAVLHHNLKYDKREGTLVAFDSKEELNQAIATAKRAQQPGQKRRSDEYFRGPPPLHGCVMRRARYRGPMSARGVRFVNDQYRHRSDVSCTDVSKPADTRTVVMRASECEESRPLFRSITEGPGDAPRVGHVGTLSAPPVLAGVGRGYLQRAGNTHKFGELGSAPGEPKMSLPCPGALLPLCLVNQVVYVSLQYHCVYLPEGVVLCLKVIIISCMLVRLILARFVLRLAVGKI